MRTCLRAVGVALLASWLGCSDFDAAEQGFCERNPGRCEVIEARVVLAPSVSATCVRFEVRDASSHAVVDTRWLPRTGDELAVTIPRNSLPQTVELAARPYRDGSCQGGQAAQTPNGTFETVTAAFVKGKTITADPLQLKPGTDSDGDQYVSPASGGSDCQDTNSGVNPGVVEQCAGQTDLNCDGRKGCEASTCGTNACGGPPAALALTLPPSSVIAGSCSSGTIQVNDINGNSSRVTSATTVGLQGSPSTGISLYSDAACTTPATGVTLNANEGSATFYFQGRTVGTVTVTAEASGLTSDTENVQLLGTRLVFTTVPRTSVAGGCSAVVTVQSLDSQGNPVPVSAATAISLSASPSTGFKLFAASACTASSEVTSVALGAGQSSASFYFQGTKSGTVGLTASTPTIALSATQNETITPAAPTKLEFSTPARTTVAGACSALITVESRDAYDNPSSVTANRIVSLGQTGAPSDPNFRFHSDSSCASAATTSVTLGSGQSSVSFYYKGQVARSVDLGASASGLTAPQPQLHTVTPAPATLLEFSGSTPPQTLLAGTCALRTIESRDPYGNVATNSMAVTLSASPQAEFFLDSGCTQATSQISIPANDGSASFYFKGITGGINATGALTLTAASPGLGSATQIETVIPTVRTGSCLIPNGATTGCPITPGLSNIARALLVFQATPQAQTGGEANVRCLLNFNDQIKCDRGSSTAADVIIQWSVAEFPAGVAVQHQDVTCSGDITSVSLSSVVRENSFLLLSSMRNSTNQASNVSRLAELTATTKAEIRKLGGTGCGGSDANHLQVVEYANSTVQRGLASLASGVGSIQVALSTAVPLDRSILLYSYTFDSTSTRICDRLVRGELTNAGSRLTFSRGEGDTSNCAGSQIPSISWEVVQFPVGTVVQQFTQQIAGGALSATVTLPTPVDPSRTIVIAGGQWASGQVHGETKYSAAEVISEGRARATLVDNKTLILSRESASASATFTVYVVQLKP